MSLDSELRSLIRDVVREVLSDEARKTPPAVVSADGSLLTVRQAAKMADVHPATVRKWIRSGTLKGYRLGRKQRVERRELETLLMNGSCGGSNGDLDAKVTAFLAADRL